MKGHNNYRLMWRDRPDQNVFLFFCSRPRPWRPRRNGRIPDSVVIVCDSSDINFSLGNHDVKSSVKNHHIQESQEETFVTVNPYLCIWWLAFGHYLKAAPSRPVSRLISVSREICLFYETSANNESLYESVNLWFYLCNFEVGLK